MAQRRGAEWLGHRLRELREQRGLTQTEVGERSGYSGKYIGEIERGRRNVQFSTVCAVFEDGLSVTLESAFSKGRVKHKPVRDRGVAVDLSELARSIARLRPPKRRKVLAAVRGVVAASR